MRHPARIAARPLATVLAAGAIAGGALASALPASASAAGDWSAYLNGPMHSSYSASETSIRPGGVRALVQKWHFAGAAATRPGQPAPGFLSSPAVAGGAVFIGSDTGWFYKLGERTGRVLSKVFIGYQPRRTCSANGFVDTATVAPDPAGHQQTVYVGGPDGYLYALRASDLSLEWKSVIALPSATVSNYFEWSSPTVANGRIYIGVSSHCDNPLIRGALIGFRQATGRKFAEFYTVPSGAIGGSVWSSVAVAPGGDVYATTGNGPPAAPQLGYSESIIKLSPGTLRPLGHFTVPRSQIRFDSDFGGSPTIFGSDVGACNKNGIYYALRRSTMTLAWQRRIGAGSNSTTYAQCSAAAVFNGKNLYFGATAVRIRGRAYRGSAQERDPANGRLLWETGLPNGVIGSPTMNGGGVIAVGTYDSSTTPNAVYLVNAASGRIIRTLIKGSADFAQGAFAGGWLFSANGTGVYAWGP